MSELTYQGKKKPFLQKLMFILAIASLLLGGIFVFFFSIFNPSITLNFAFGATWYLLMGMFFTIMYFVPRWE